MTAPIPPQPPVPPVPGSSHPHAPPADGTTLVVLEPHDASQPVSLSMRAGDAVRVGRRDDTWAEWLWCTAADGRESWVPEAFLELRPGGTEAVACRDYDATELTVRPGELVEVLEEVSGWLLCRRGGDQGWIPAERLYHRGGRTRRPCT